MLASRKALSNELFSFSEFWLNAPMLSAFPIIGAARTFDGLMAILREGQIWRKLFLAVLGRGKPLWQSSLHYGPIKHASS